MHKEKRAPMTYKEKLSKLIRESYQKDQADGKSILEPALNHLLSELDELTEDQAKILVTLNGSVEVFEDGAMSPPYELGMLLVIAMINISVTSAIKPEEVKLSQISEYVSSLASELITPQRGKKRKAPSAEFTNAGFWNEIAKILEEATKPKNFIALYPTTYTFPTAKLYNGLPAASVPPKKKEDDNGNSKNDDENPKKKAAPMVRGKFEVIKATKTTPAVNSTVIIDSSNLSNVSGANNITPIDMSYQNAYITLLLQGNEAITPAMLARVAAGLSPGQDVSPRQIEEAKASMEKQMATLLTIDATEEAKAYGHKSGLLKGNMIYAKFAQVVSINGKTTSAYLPLHGDNGKIDFPILYQYAAISGQIATVPYDLLQIPSISSSQNNIVLRNYLLLQIKGMEKGSLSRKIKYSTIFERLGMNEKETTNWKIKTSRIRSTTMKMLDYWKTKGFIKSYRPYKKGNTIEGLEITI